MTILKSWKPSYRYFFIAVLSLFTLQGIWFTLKQGNDVYMPTDGTSEQITIFAAKHFARHGFLENSLLPTYPPFGNNLDGSPRTEPFVYNHYLAGQDLVLGVWIKVFGENHLGLARLIPHFLTVIGIGLFSLAFGQLFRSPVTSCVMLALFMVPRSLTVWSTCLWGHSHATALFLIFLSFFLAGVTGKSNLISRFVLPLFGALSIAFFSIDWLPAYFFCLMALVFLFQKKSPLTAAVLPAIGSICGGMLAVIYQVTISSFYYGSLSKMILEMKAWFAVRSQIFSNTTSSFGKDFIDHPIHRVLSEMNKQGYGATGFTLYNLIAITLIFIAMGYFSRVLKKAECRNTMISLAFGYLGVISWPVLMKHHAMGNIHFVVRHCFALYFITICICVPLIFRIVNKARTA